MRGFLIGESLMNIIYIIQGDFPRMDLPTRCLLTYARSNYQDNEWYTRLYKRNMQRYKYIYCQADTLFPSHSLLCGGYISYLNRGHDFNKLFIII